VGISIYKESVQGAIRPLISSLERGPWDRSTKLRSLVYLGYQFIYNRPHIYDEAVEVSRCFVMRCEEAFGLVHENTFEAVESLASLKAVQKSDESDAM
jgi:hypothetical protein